DLELRDDHEVCPARDTSHQRDPAGVAAHHLDHHHAVVGGGGRVQAVERFGDDADGGVEADAELGRRKVVVDRLGNSDCGVSSLVQPGRHAEGVVAADRHQCVDAVVTEGFDHALDPVLLFGRVGARGAEDGAAHGQDAAYVGGRELVYQSFLEAAGPAVLNTADLVPELEGSPCHGADGGVEPGRVATAGEDPDAHEHRL